MKIAAIALGFLLCTQVWAKPPKDVQYQDAVLVSFKDITTGSNCSSNGTVKGKVDDDGNVSGDSNSTTSCSDKTMRHYTIKVGDSVFVLEPSMSGGQKAGAVASLGWSAVFAKKSVLWNQLPGTHMQVRSDPHGFYVKVGNRESLYDIVGAK
jgi:hypothetical protein